MSSIAETVTEVTGAVVGTYNKVRTEKVSKMLRDDYTALSMMCLTNSMLFTTAKALGETAVSEVVATHIHDFPPLVVQLNSVIPEVVIAEIRKRELTVVDASASEEAVKLSETAWREA
jgi:hypothetical protein